jgi:hypothetical protein
MHPTDLEDPTILERLADPSAIDGRDWLVSPTVVIGQLNAGEARSLFEDLYRLGASRIVVSDTARSGNEAIAANVVVQVSPFTDRWQKVFDFCADFCRRHGWWQNPEHQQALLLLRVDGDQHLCSVPLATLDYADQTSNPQIIQSVVNSTISSQLP